MLPQLPPAVLALADGTVFRGHAIGAPGRTVGEVVFNTAITGYQEILTDPSYCRQIVTLTYPHVGNYGITPEDAEAGRIHAAGLVIKDLPIRASNFRATATLGDYLRGEGVPHGVRTIGLPLTFDGVRPDRDAAAPALGEANPEFLGRPAPQG